MKIKNNFYRILALIFIFTIISCSSDDAADSNNPKDETIVDDDVSIDQEDNTNLFKKDFLINTVWKIKSITSSVDIDENGDGNFIKNTLSQSGTCKLDDTYIFSSENNSVSISDNNNSCDVNDRLLANGFFYSNSSSVFFETDDEDNILSIRFASQLSGMFCDCDTLTELEARLVNGKKQIVGKILNRNLGIKKDVVYTYVLEELK